MSRRSIQKRLDVLEHVPAEHVRAGSVVLAELSLSALQAIEDTYLRFWPVPHSPYLGDAIPPASDWDGSVEPLGFQDRILAIVRADAPDPETFDRWLNLLEIR
jgi:hypothetical protein